MQEVTPGLFIMGDCWWNDRWWRNISGFIGTGLFHRKGRPQNISWLTPVYLLFPCVRWCGYTTLSVLVNVAWCLSSCHRCSRCLESNFWMSFKKVQSTTSVYTSWLLVPLYLFSGALPHKGHPSALCSVSFFFLFCFSSAPPLQNVLCCSWLLPAALQNDVWAESRHLLGVFTW